MDYATIICAALSMLSAVLVSTITARSNSKVAREKRIQEQENAQRKLNAEQVITINKTISDGLNSVRNEIKAVDAKQDRLAKRVEDIALGEQASLRDRLCQIHRICVERGWTGERDLTNFENIYQKYHNLGNNGVMDKYREEMYELPTMQSSTNLVK